MAKPHRCPLCEGAGKGKDDVTCHACNGHGIVWEDGSRSGPQEGASDPESPLHITGL